MRYRASSIRWEAALGFEVNTLAKKASRKTRKEQRRDVLGWIRDLAAVAFWVLRILFLLWDRFSR